MEYYFNASSQNTRQVQHINPSQMYNIPTQNSQLENFKAPENNVNQESTPNSAMNRSPSPPIKAKWLSRFHRLNLNQETTVTEIDQKPNETTLWIEAVKNNIRVEANLTIKKNRSYDRSGASGDQSDSSYAQHKIGNSTSKNFKCFVKRHNYIPQTRIIPTKPFYEDLIQY